MGVIIRQGFKAALSNYIGMGLGFLSLFILLPLFYTPEKLGAVRLFIELGTVLSSFALIGTHYSINRFFPFFKTADEQHHGFFFWVLIFPFIGFCLLLIVLLIGGDSIFLFINANALKYKELFPMLILLVFIILYQVVSEVTCANHGRIAVPNFMREIVMRALIIVAGLLYYFNVVSFTQSVWLIVLAYAIALLGNLWFLGQLTKINLRPNLDFIRKNPHIKKDSLRFTMLLFFSGIASLLYTKMDFFMISALQKDLSDVAIYSIGFYLATFIEIPKRTILQVATPVFSNLMKESKFKEVEALNKKNGSNQLLVSGILFFMIWLNIDNLYELMPRGDFYQRGKWVVFFIGISKLIDAVVCGNSPIIVNSKFYGLSTFSIIVAVISSFIFNYIFITKFGIIGGAISTILVMISVNLCNLLVLQYKLKINPFHKDQIKISLLLILFFAFTFIGDWVSNPIVDSIVKSSILGSALIFTVFKLKLSQDFNSLLCSKIPFLKNL
jgi:O-antigen/teichoic acid export membrane protein